MLERSDPERAEHLQALAQADVDERWRYYEQLAEVERNMPVDKHDAIHQPDHEEQLAEKGES